MSKRLTETERQISVVSEKEGNNHSIDGRSLYTCTYVLRVWIVIPKRKKTKEKARGKSMVNQSTVGKAIIVPFLKYNLKWNFKSAL